MTTNIYSNQWLDQVFEQRNKKYGAYVLRQKADDYTLTGLFAAVSIVVAVFITPMILNIFNGDAIPKPIFDPTIFTVIDPPVFIPPVEKIPTVETLHSNVSAPTNDMIKPMIVNNDDQVDDKQRKDLDNDDPNKFNVSLNGTGNPNDTATGLGTGNSVPSFASIDTNIYRGSVEIMPQFPGGENAMLNFLVSNLKYPRNLIDNNITGTVYLSFIVNREGDVTGIDVLRGVRESKDFENEAKRVVAMMPKWKPGRQNGQNVSVCFTLPVRFSLR
ncbi:MAG: energy transducer TonB [Bacteroidia bacterium]